MDPRVIDDSLKMTIDVDKETVFFSDQPLNLQTLVKSNTEIHAREADHPKCLGNEFNIKLH